MMKDTVERLLRLAQQGDLNALKTFLNSIYPSLEDGSPNLEWTSAHHPKSGDTVQIVAARHGHKTALQWMAEDLGLELEQSNFGGKRPLHEAAQYGHVDCVQYLLSRGVYVDCLKQADWTPLMLACTKHSLPVVRELVEAKEGGAKVSLKNKDGWTCFHIAVREGDIDIVNYLLDVAPEVWDTVSKNGRTPLHTATLHGRLAVTKVLINRGRYPVDQKDSCGSTPFMDAVLNGHTEVAEFLLLQHGASLSSENNMGRQVMHQVAQVGNINAVKYLVEKHHVSVNICASGSKVTPLHTAAKERQHEMLKLLLELGAKVQTTDTKGRTALHIAAGVQDARGVTLLLAHGALNCADASGTLASDLAITTELKKLF